LPAIVPTTAGDVIGSIVEHNSGWREDADTHDGVDLSEHDFNYDEFIKQEFGSQAKPAGLKTIWWIVGIALIIAFVLYFSSAR